MLDVRALRQRMSRGLLDGADVNWLFLFQVCPANWVLLHVRVALLRVSVVSRHGLMGQGIGIDWFVLGFPCSQRSAHKSSMYDRGQIGWFCCDVALSPCLQAGPKFCGVADSQNVQVAHQVAAGPELCGLAAIQNVQVAHQVGDSMSLLCWLCYALAASQNVEAAHRVAFFMCVFFSKNVQATDRIPCFMFMLC
ncbi:hypothetical protein L7F22_047198 [Adiantum nelumboides]|nr:hypothetical protein [Adiantum nelumboides]MCO5593191.1 hypothetical protein [Adiantum nelumboides]